jgi:hypothetical protein
MNDVLYDYLDNFSVVYLDDIIIYNKRIKDHVIHLSKVLRRLREQKLYVKKEKYKYVKSKIMFIDHLVKEVQMRMNPKKVQVIF